MFSNSFKRDQFYRFNLLRSFQLKFEFEKYLNRSNLKRKISNPKKQNGKMRFREPEHELKEIGNAK